MLYEQKELRVLEHAVYLHITVYVLQFAIANVVQSRKQILSNIGKPTRKHSNDHYYGKWKTNYLVGQTTNSLSFCQMCGADMSRSGGTPTRNIGTLIIPLRKIKRIIWDRGKSLTFAFVR